MRGVVKEVHSKKIVLSDGTDVPYGLLVWSTGVGPSEFVKSLHLPKAPGGRYIYINKLTNPTNHHSLQEDPLLVSYITVYNVFQPVNSIEWNRIGVDGWLRVPSVEDVFALGDCAGFLEQTGRPVLPALAQVCKDENFIWMMKHKSIN